MPDFPESGVLSDLPRFADREVEQSPLETEVVALFDELRERLLRYLLTFRALPVQDCEEVVQEAFLALFLHLQQGRSRQNLRGWLFRVVHNVGLKRIQRSRRVAQALEDFDWAPASALNPEDALAQDQSYRRLTAVIQALPRQDRQCLALRAEGLRYREIAEVLDISIGSVAKSLERALARIARATK
ncbi:MAG: sigma-70 family RNA polymerase sigma factor [Bryobacterales bacterium]|nr:sigma-70 family RNA polymerase sigma factor [Bryobacterales bacterium]